MNPQLAELDVAIAIIWQAPRVLICRRPDGAPLGEFWEFPGGKREQNESIQQCLLRELKEELDVLVTPVASLSAVVHAYPKTQVTLHPFICTIVSGQLKALACTEFKWIEPAALTDYQFPPANAELIQMVIDYLQSRQQR